MESGGTEEAIQDFVVFAVCPASIGFREADRYTFSFM